MFQSNDQEESIVKAISKAIRHAKRVSKKEHIKANRIERVSQFVVSLRRELGVMCKSKSSICHFMLDKAMWHDIGVMTLQFNPYSPVTRDHVSRWLREASMINMTNSEAVKYEIESDFEDLESVLLGCEQACDEMKKINQESMEIIKGLCCLFNDD